MKNLGDLQDLIEATDQIILGIESGLQLQQAMGAALSILPNRRVSVVIRRLLFKTALGLSLLESLELEMKREDGLLRNFLESLALSLKMGTDLKKILLEKSDNLNEEIQTTIEEFAAKAPVKMLFPLVLFIFPTLFVILGGGVLSDLASLF